MRNIFSLCAVILIAGIILPTPAFGLMSSSNFTIFADSVDAGGVFSSGGGYELEDTLGESPIGFSTSSEYEVRGGYQAMDWATLTFTLSTTSVDLGVAVIAAVSTGDCTTTITTDADTGYSLSVTDISGTHLSDVADGSVTAGSEEYGLALTGIDRLFADDRAITAGLNLTSSSTPVTDTQTVLTFKAAITGATAIGTRTQTITLTASANI